MSSAKKHDPCHKCGGYVHSKGGGRLRCDTCKATRAVDSDPKHPEGHVLKGVSTMLGPDGEIKAQWYKTDLARQGKDEALRRLTEDLADLVPPRQPLPAVSEERDDDLLAVYPLGDPHFGMLSWDDETGKSFDIHIAKKNMQAAIDYLVDQGPRAKNAAVISLGDFYHSDNLQNKTVRSGNVLDVDSRWYRILQVGFQSFVGTIEAALLRHEKVHVIVEIGNHDDHSAAFLSIALDAWYRNEPRVTVDKSPAKYHYLKFGRNLIGVTHGDTVKHSDLESIMFHDCKDNIGDTDYRYWYVGHIHHTKKLEYRNCVVESFRTLAPQDAWHHAHGYRSKSDMVKIILHREYGEAYRSIIDWRRLSHGV